MRSAVPLLQVLAQWAEVARGGVETSGLPGDLLPETVCNFDQIVSISAKFSPTSGTAIIARYSTTSGSAIIAKYSLTSGTGKL